MRITLTDEPSQSDTTRSPDTVKDEEQKETFIIQAFGMFWQRKSVHWTSSPSLWGKQQIGAKKVDFKNQKGVYLLHYGREVVYVGRAVDRPLGKRLYEHTQDRLRGRWDSFSWFGLLCVTEKGELKEVSITPSVDIIIGTLEAVLIEGLEPSQNRKRGDDFNAIEYLQDEDPEIKKQQKRVLIAEMQKELLQT